MIKISVIVPIYNAEKYIEKCLWSLINQTIKNIEIILVDDGSIDRTGEICNRLATENKNVKYFKIENSGCSFARNYGIKKSIGEYITFVDADDWVDKNMYFEMYQKSKDEELDILICGYEKINQRDEVIEEIFPELKLKNDYIDLKSAWFNCVWNKIYKRNLIIDNDIKFLEKCHMGEDMVFNIKIFKIAKKIEVINKVYYKYFINENSVMFNPDKRIEIFDAIKEVKSIGIDLKKLDICIREHGIISFFRMIENIKENKGDWEKYYEAFLKSFFYFKKDIFFKTKFILIYRKLRLKFIFLKKYIKR